MKSDLEKFRLSRKSKRTGVCKVCGWRDGDGQKVCFYSKELGQVVHENSEAAMLREMTKVQQSLYISYHSSAIAYEEPMILQTIKQEVRKIEQAIKRERSERDELIAELRLKAETLKHKYPHSTLSANETKALNRKIIRHKQKHIQRYKKALSIYRHHKNAVLDITLSVAPSKWKKHVLLNTALRRGYVLVRDYNDGTFLVQLPHTCGGVGYQYAPYHIKCTGCRREIKLWEFGVEYDVG